MCTTAYIDPGTRRLRFRMEGPHRPIPRGIACSSESTGGVGRSLCLRRLSGGGRSLWETRLWERIPDQQGKYREVFDDWPLLAELQLRVLWEEVLRRFERIEVQDEPERTLSSFVKGYTYLPVRIKRK